MLTDEATPAAVAGSARQLGITVLEKGTRPANAVLIQGEWPGLRIAQERGDASAGGPTGAPWIDSNGWQVRLARVRNPGKAVWVAAEPPKSTAVLSPESHILAVADTAADGGRWVLTLDSALASGLRSGNAGALAAWKTILGAAGFFAARRSWDSFQPDAFLGILSDFSGGNEFFSGELLNLTARLQQPYRILDKSGGVSLHGLKAVIYPDAQPPGAGLRKRLLGFVESGGLLVTGAGFGGSEGKPLSPDTHPRYAVRALGRGRIAVGALDDPFLAAADAQVLMSHRNDLLRVWNGTAMGCHYTLAPGGKGALLQIVNYTGRPGTNPASVRVAVPYRSARIRTLESPEPAPVKVLAGKDAIEMHLPPISAYAAIELS
ncbi:MAG: hypothetical protein M1436_02815 [Acidobacteria bacterium]|nr:hypothetical protein [Acidobacteriota bacterium]